MYSFRSTSLPEKYLECDSHRYKYARKRISYFRIQIEKMGHRNFAVRILAAEGEAGGGSEGEGCV
jgi:hypothetical protein